MNLSISNRVVKDASRLPQPTQNQLATVLRAIQNAQNYADIPRFRALTGYKNTIVFASVIIVWVSFGLVMVSSQSL